jgi:hypothetical protein
MTDLSDAALNNPQLEVDEYRDTLHRLEARLTEVEAERDRYADWLVEILRALGLTEHTRNNLGWQVEQQVLPRLRALHPRASQARRGEVAHSGDR